MKDLFSKPRYKNIMALAGTALTLAGTLLGNKVNDKKQEDLINKKVEEMFEEYTSTPIEKDEA